MIATTFVKDIQNLCFMPFGSVEWLRMCGMGVQSDYRKFLSGQHDIMQLEGEGKMDKMELPPSYMV